MASITRTRSDARVRIVESVQFHEGEHVTGSYSSRRINVDTMHVILEAHAEGGEWPTEWEPADPSWSLTGSARGRYVKKDGTVGAQVASYIPSLDMDVVDRLRADMIARWGTPAEAFAKVGA